MTSMSPSTAAVMGALVADAAAMGLHWIYDPERIAEVAGDASAAFIPPLAANFEGTRAFFAHAARSNGDLSQYGEVLALAMGCIARSGAFDVPAYQEAYAAHFGAGGTYSGYIDRPTRGTLANLAADVRNPSGVDDDQHPAVATLPAILARYHAAPQCEDTLRTAIAVTNANAEAERYGMIFASCLGDILRGTPLHSALSAAAAQDAKLGAALDAGDMNSTDYGEITGRACHLYQGMPLAFHILETTQDYASAIEANIRAGGDSCGRAIIIGSLAGAAYGGQSIPLDWLLRLKDGHQHFVNATKLSTNS